MSEELVDVRELLAASGQVRVEIGRDDVLHVLVGSVTLHLDRAACEALTTTLAKAMVRLAKCQPRPRRGALRIVESRES